jgi:hypothetical protein
MNVKVDVTRANRHVRAFAGRRCLRLLAGIPNDLQGRVEVVGDLQQFNANRTGGNDVDHRAIAANRAGEPIVNATPHSVAKGARPDHGCPNPVEYSHGRPPPHYRY